MKKSLLCLLFCLAMFPTFAQKNLTNKGNTYFKQMAYPQAIPYYIKALKKDSAFQDAVFHLADCYRLTNNHEMAEKWYAKAVQMPLATGLHKFYYGQALMNNGKYAEARKWMEDFVLDNKTDGRGQAFIHAIDLYESFFTDSNSYAVTKLNINSPNADFGAAIFQEGIVFSSSRKRTEMIQRTHAWTNEPFLKLYYARGKEDQFREPETFAENLSTKFNDGPVCFSKKGDEIYITRNNIEGNKVHRSSDKTVMLKIFKAKSSGTSWSSVTPFQYNSDNYSCAHPALSADGTKLYFASNMPGGKGGMDLYVCTKSGDGWGKPENLGDTVNTRGNEMFPVIMDDGTLYFSSDGHPGIGGLDIYYTRDIGGKYVLPVNVGYPLNTSEDDFNMVYDVKNKIGYLSSNRANRGFDDDIYTFKRKSIHIRGIVINKETGLPVQNARVELKLENNTLNFTTLENGRFDFPADFDKNYTIKGIAKDLGDTTFTVSTEGTLVADPFVRIELGKPAPFAMIINVIDADTKQPLPGATIRDETAQHDIGSTDATGKFMQPIVPKKDEQLIISLPGYRPKVIMLKGQEGQLPKDITYTIELTAASDVHPWENWYKIIYYDLDKFNMRDDAAKIMDEVAAFLIEHPEVKIGINSHTDSRATKEYNEKLSENRSKSCKQYLVKKGVNSKQIEKLTWSGESVLVNNCGDGDPCTEEMHQLNRRTELTVTSVTH